MNMRGHMANNIRNAFNIIDTIYEAVSNYLNENSSCANDVRDIIDGLESIHRRKTLFERFFSWENVTFKPFEELDKSDSDEVFAASISPSEKAARYKAISKYIESEYVGSSLSMAMNVFRNSYLAMFSDSASDKALDNFDSEFFPTSFGEFRTKSKGIPLLIPDPRLARTELIKHFDRTTILGLTARNAIRDGYVYDASLLHRILVITATFLSVYSPAENFFTFFNSTKFFDTLVIPGTEKTIKTLFLEDYKENYILSSDTRTVRGFKEEILNSLTTFPQALATMAIVDFSFFYPFVVTRFIINSRGDEPVALKNFKDAAQSLYGEMLSFNEYVVANA